MSRLTQKIEDINGSIDKFIDVLDAKGVLGPISYLEEAQSNLASALEEIELYEGGEE